MKDIKIILNPVAGRGYSGKAEPAIRNYLLDENLDFDLVKTEYIGHAIELAKQAVSEGFKIVVAAGGDGTTNEVINGLMAASSTGAESILGLLPTGTGSDFSYNVGIPENLHKACKRLSSGKTRKVDLIKFSMPGKGDRFFDNQLGIGFDGLITIEAKKYKRLRGMALYLPVVLKTVFLTNGATNATLKFNDQELNLATTQISVTNAAREGGGFFMTPDAKVDDGLLDVLVVKHMSKFSMLKLIPHFMKGTHISLDSTKTFQAQKITISSDDNIVAHYDGELLCTDGHYIECEIVPKCLEVIY